MRSSSIRTTRTSPNPEAIAHMNFKAAVAQIDPKVGNLKSNLDLHLKVVDKAIRAGAKLILFPELSLTGYSLRDLAQEVALDPDDSFFSPLKKKSKSITIVLGFVESGQDHGIYNSAMVLEEGKVKHVHRKIYPPTYGMFEEGRYFGLGNTIQAFDSKLGRFGVLICEDAWHLSLPYLLARDGAEVLLSLTASPTRLAGDHKDLLNAEVNHEHHRAYARLLSVYYLFSNRVGFEDGVNFWGGSAIVGPSGETIVLAKYFSDDLIFSQLDTKEVRRARVSSRHFLDENIDLVSRSIHRIASKRS